MRYGTVNGTSSIHGTERFNGYGTERLQYGNSANGTNLLRYGTEAARNSLNSVEPLSRYGTERMRCVRYGTVNGTEFG